MPVDISVTFLGKPVTFKGAISVKSFSWGADNATSIGSASAGAGAGKTKFMEAVISKEVDAQASPVLLQLLTTGEHLDSATFEIRKAGGPNQAGPMNNSLISIKLSQVFVTHLEQSVSVGDESPTELVHFAYAAMNVAFNQQSVQGTTTPGPSVSWNQVTNQATDAVPL